MDKISAEKITDKVRKKLKPHDFYDEDLELVCDVVFEVLFNEV